jgi:NAD(P)-dependent dehydrogenase (short-subunit alcohol dehydrogenase family)
MSRIFITGSADGLGQLAAKALLGQGHQVVLHARSETRAQEALSKTLGAENIVTGDLSSIEETKALALKVNKLGAFDAIIHNAAVYYASGEDIFAVNVLAPYILTSLIEKPRRLIYLSSDMHAGGKAKLERFKTDISGITYSDSKLHVLMLCKAVARKWAGVYANALNPGWVPTKMGGTNAPDSFESGYQTQVWLATSNDENAKVSGRFFYHKNQIPSKHEADDVQAQEEFLKLCAEITGVSFPMAG